MRSYLAQRLVYRLGSGLLVLSGLLACGLWTRFGEPPASYFDTPLFPGAQAVATQGRDLQDHTQSPIGRKVVSFQAPAAPATVLAYYRDRLRQDGWTVEDQDRTPTTLHAFWGAAGQPGAIYSFDVQTQARPEPATVVTLTLYTIGR